MSLPKQYTTTASPPLSSSSKQSIPGAPTSAQPPVSQQPEHDQQSHHETAENIASQHFENQHISDHPSISHQQFHPFFTLIEDANTNEYHHPTVHYIFSDDDTDILTEAAVRSLESEQENPPNTAAKGPTKFNRDEQHEEPYNEDEFSGSRKAESLLPPPIPGVKDNYVILDVEPTSVDTPHKTTDTDPNHAGGTKSLSTSPANQPAIPPPQHNQQQPQPSPPQFTVTSAHSLTPAWQVINTELVPAPTFENNTSGEQPLNGGLMLKIHGTPGLQPSAVSKDRDKERGGQRLEDMMDQFAKRMAELRQVIDAGEQRGLCEEQLQEHPGEQNTLKDQPAEDNNDNSNNAAGTAQKEGGQPEGHTQGQDDAGHVNQTEVGLSDAKESA